MFSTLKHKLIDGTFFFVSGNTSDDEERLVRDLFRGYNKLIRPVQNMTNKVDVKFGLAFVQLINVVSTTFILSYSSLMQMIVDLLENSLKIALW